jgi:polysaccharide deacetylase 2 family uncharacterized protein YibQ
VFQTLKAQQRDLIFVDSLTHPRSVAADAARASGFAALSRDVFLDHEPDAASVAAQLDLAIAQAVAEGEAIAIGHPRPATLQVLSQARSKAEAEGVELVYVSALIAP